MIRNYNNPGILPLTIPPYQGESFEARWPDAPSVADTYRMGELAGMDQYRETPGHEAFGAYDKAQWQREKDRQLNSEVEQRLARSMADEGQFGPANVSFSGVTPSQAGHDRDKFIENWVVPHDVLGATQMFSNAGGRVLAGLGGVALSSSAAEAAGLTPRQAKMLRKERAQRMGGVLDETIYNELPEYANPRAVIGGNKPPPEFRIAPDEATQAAAAMTPAQLNAAWMQGLPRPKPADTSTAIPDIRGMPVADAIAIARTQPHLVRAGEQSPGYYVGGPEGITSKATLNAQRRAFDKTIAEDPRGWDWYDRFRAGQNLTTGGNPEQNLWQAAQHGQFSAGVSPEHELNLALKENNAAIAGMPYKAGTPAQHEAFMRALATKDPLQHQLGEKTYEYFVKTNADQPGVPVGGTATGVNDFRQGNVHGYPEGYDKAFTSAQHKYLDYETALAVDRANKANLMGRSDWTGEKLQAIPWVIDKARALMSRNAELTYEQAMQQALKTVVDFYPKHTYLATHEAQPGANVVGHMTGSVNAPQSVKDQFALDPKSSWANAPMGRDAIYSGLGVEGTGNYMRVLPSTPMQGVYTNPQGVDEFNLGQVARPLGAFQAPRKDAKTKKIIPEDVDAPFKRSADAEQTILNAGEAVRGYIDAQNASTWHKHWMGGPNKESASLFFPRDKPASQQEILALRNVGRQYGLGDVADTGEGLTLTAFGGSGVPSKDLERAIKQGVFGQFGPFQRSKVDSGYIDYVGKWDEAGSGQATRHMLDYISKTPELRDAFNRNEFIGQNALARMQRDDAWAARWGAPREDIQRAREIISKGPGWVDRLEAALAAGVLLPATVAAIFAGASAVPQSGGQNGT